MADPLSIAASIIAVVTLAREVTTSIDAFLSSYRAADSELKIIAQEVEDLHNVLKILHEKSAAEPQVPRSELSTADQVLLGVLKDPGGCVTELDVVVKKSCERMGKGGVHKLRVQVIWQSTSKGIEKVKAHFLIELRVESCPLTNSARFMRQYFHEIPVNKKLTMSDSDFIIKTQDDTDAFVTSQDSVCSPPFACNRIAADHLQRSKRHTGNNQERDRSSYPKVPRL